MERWIFLEHRTTGVRPRGKNADGIFIGPEVNLELNKWVRAIGIKFKSEEGEN